MLACSCAFPLGESPNKQNHSMMPVYRTRRWIVMRIAVNFASAEIARRNLTITATNKKPRHSLEPGVPREYGLAVTYFRVRNAHYHRRKPVSRFCSGWEGVVIGAYALAKSINAEATPIPR